MPSRPMRNEAKAQRPFGAPGTSPGLSAVSLARNVTLSWQEARGIPPSDKGRVFSFSLEYVIDTESIRPKGRDKIPELHPCISGTTQPECELFSPRRLKA